MPFPTLEIGLPLSLLVVAAIAHWLLGKATRPEPTPEKKTGNVVILVGLRILERQRVVRKKF